MASFGYPQEVIDEETHIGQVIMGQGIERSTPIVLDEVSRSTDYLTGIPGARRNLAVPLIVEERAIGVLNVESTGPQLKTIFYFVTGITDLCACMG